VRYFVYPLIPFAQINIEGRECCALRITGQALAMFLVAYALAIVEEHFHLWKSTRHGGAIWILRGIAYTSQHQFHAMAQIRCHNLLECWIDAVSAFVPHTMSEPNIFEALRTRFVSLSLSLRPLNNLHRSMPISRILVLTQGMESPV
jgi:hypothetical protein